MAGQVGGRWDTAHQLPMFVRVLIFMAKGSECWDYTTNYSLSLPEASHLF